MHRGANAPLTCTFPGLREHAVKERNQNIVKTLEHLVKHIKAAQEFTEKVKKKTKFKENKKHQKAKNITPQNCSNVKKGFYSKNLFNTSTLEILLQLNKPVTH